MRAMSVVAGIMFLSASVFADVQERDRGEKKEKTPVIVEENPQTIKIHENYPNPF